MLTVSHVRGGESVQLTKFSNENRFFRVWCPLSVDHGIVWLDVNTHLVVPIHERPISAFGGKDSFFPLPEELVAVEDGRHLVLEPWVDVEYGLAVEGLSGHGRFLAICTGGERDDGRQEQDGFQALKIIYPPPT